MLELMGKIFGTGKVGCWSSGKFLARILELIVILFYYTMLELSRFFFWMGQVLELRNKE